MADDSPAETAAIVQRYIEDEHGHLLRLNTRVDAIERGCIVMTIPYGEKLTNAMSSPTIHGGITATLIDAAGGIAFRTMLDDPLVGGVAIINLNVNYLRWAPGDLTMVAEAICVSGSVDVGTITIISTDPEEDPDVTAWQLPSSDRNDVVATGRGAYWLFRE